MIARAAILTLLTGASAWWVGLDAPRDHAKTGGVHGLRAPASGRLRIPGGTFTMGSRPIEMVQAIMMCRRELRRALCDEVEIGNVFRAEGADHEVTLSAFDLDRTEVRVGDYARCVAAGACAAPGFAPGDPRFDRPDLPVVFVTWDDASAYCAWAGGRLPTEAEWEYAARGPEGRTFPWGMLYNSHLSNHGAFADDPTDASDGFAYLAPVGSFPDGATPLGALDMAGNAAEWVADFFDTDMEGGFGYEKRPQVNPTGPKSGVTHVVRGGSYQKGAPWLRAASRVSRVLPRTDDVGFRCAADVR